MQEQLPRDALERPVSDLHNIPLDEHMCPPGGFASHIPVLNREVPFILNITLGSVRNQRTVVSDRSTAVRLKLGWWYCLTRTLRDRTSSKSLQGCTCGVSW